MESLSLLVLLTLQLVVLHAHAQSKRAKMIRTLWILNLVGGVAWSAFAITDFVMKNGTFDYWYLHVVLGVYMILLSSVTLGMLRQKKEAI